MLINCVVVYGRTSCKTASGWWVILVKYVLIKKEKKWWNYTFKLLPHLPLANELISWARNRNRSGGMARSAAMDAENLMMTSSNGNFFPRYWSFVMGIQRSPVVPLTKVSDAVLWFFLWFAPEQTVEQAIETPVSWDAITLIMTSL